MLRTEFNQEGSVWFFEHNDALEKIADRDDLPAYSVAMLHPEHYRGPRNEVSSFVVGEDMKIHNVPSNWTWG